MGIGETFVVALCLGMDAFSVGLGVGSQLGKASKRQTFRLSFHFGLFQFFMPLVGWVVGRSALGVVRDWDHWVAFGILFAIGLHMIVESMRAEKAVQRGRDPTRGWSLVGLSLATSMDALGVGVGMGILGRRLLNSALIIGVVAGLMTLIGMRSGGILRAVVGRRMETVGGLVLIGLAFKMLAI